MVERMKKKKKVVDQTTAKSVPIKGLHINLTHFVWLGAMVMLFYPVFVRGLFFSPEWLTAQILLGGLLILFALDVHVGRKMPLGWSYRPLTFTLYVLFAAYAFTLFTAVNMTAAFQGVIKLFCYVSFYLIILYLIRSKKDMDRILRIFFLSGLGIALVGLLSAAGIIDFPGAYTGRRISATLQYPNTLAVYLLAAWVVGLYLWSNAKSLASKLVYGVGIFFIITVLMGTQSRGVFVLVPLALMFWVAGLPKERFWEGVYYTVFVGGASLMIGRMFIPALLDGSGALAFRWSLLGALLVGAIVLVFHYGPDYMKRRRVDPRYRTLLAVAGLVYLLLMLTIYYVYAVDVVPDIAREFVPTEVVKRVETINPDNQSLVSRMVYYQDAWRMIKDQPVFGVGAGGWESLYHQYKSANYYTTEVHNHFLQVWIEAGLLGFIAFTGSFFALLGMTLKKWKRRGKASHWTTLWTVLTALLVLGVHSAIDFNLSLPAITLTLFAFFALGQGGLTLFAERKGEESLYKRVLQGFKESRGRVTLQGIRLLITCILGFLLIFGGTQFYRAGTLGSMAVRAMQNGDYTQSVTYLEQATRKNPVQGSYAADLAQSYMYLAVENLDPVLAQAARKQADRAILLEPYNPRIRLALADTFYYLGDLDRYVESHGELKGMVPMEISYWEGYAGALLTTARYKLEQGNAETAQIYAEKASNLYQEAQQWELAIEERGVEKSTRNRFSTSDALYLASGQAAYLLGNDSAAFEVFTALLENENHWVSAQSWLAALLLRRGEEESAQTILNNYDQESIEEIITLSTLRI